uniref:Uncharacterized protein n=1 Tax=Angiostrongylus cantonensis TaxID=6313 RepID=A0A0K0D7J2_ANGCA
MVCFRVLCLYIVNYYTLIVSLMMKLRDIENERKVLEESQMVPINSISGLRTVTQNRTVRDLVTSSFSDRISPHTTPAPLEPWTTVRKYRCE